LLAPDRRHQGIAFFRVQPRMQRFVYQPMRHVAEAATLSASHLDDVTLGGWVDDYSQGWVGTGQ
jgi:hypothetical protein